MLAYVSHLKITLKIPSSCKRRVVSRGDKAAVHAPSIREKKCFECEKKKEECLCTIRQGNQCTDTARVADDLSP